MDPILPGAAFLSTGLPNSEILSEELNAMRRVGRAQAELVAFLVVCCSAKSISFLPDSDRRVAVLLALPVADGQAAAIPLSRCPYSSSAGEMARLFLWFPNQKLMGQAFRMQPKVTSRQQHSTNSSIIRLMRSGVGY